MKGFSSSRVLLLTELANENRYVGQADNKSSGETIMTASVHHFVPLVDDL